MAAVARMGFPTLMVTFTGSPTWPEALANLLPDQTGIVDRVFKIKLNHLLADLKSIFFGKCAYIMHVIGIPSQRRCACPYYRRIRGAEPKTACRG